MNKVKINIAASIVLQIVTIVSGFVIPKVMLVYFGSNVNGLISSVNQFLNYVTLLEGGIGSVTMAMLYKPLYNGDSKKVSQIVNTTIKTFKTLSIIYIIYVCAFSCIYPQFIDTGFDFFNSVILIWILALNLFFQYFLSISYRLLLNADRKVAYYSLVQTAAFLLNLIGVVVCARFFKNVIVIKTISAVAFLIQPIACHIYVKKHYSINKKDGFDPETEKHRWDGLGINTAFFIHSNTDIAILTVFASLADVSIYAVYILVVKALKNLVVSISSAISPSLGNVLASGDTEKANKVFSTYEFGIGFITTFLFTCGMILITPFVDVYTSEISDANYHQPLFGALILLSEMIYCYRDPYVSASYSAGHIRQVTKYAYIEAALNIVISIIFVKNFGLVGVAIGTTISMFYRECMQAVYLKKNILKRPIRLFFKSCVMHIISIVPSILICFAFVNLSVDSYLEWILAAIKVSAVVGMLTIISCVLFSKEFFVGFVKKIMRK